MAPPRASAARVGLGRRLVGGQQRAQAGDARPLVRRAVAPLAAQIEPVASVTNELAVIEAQYPAAPAARRAEKERPRSAVGKAPMRELDLAGEPADLDQGRGLAVLDDAKRAQPRACHEGQIIPARELRRPLH